MAQKKLRRKRLENPKKQYRLDQCALYKLRGKGQLLNRLGWEGSFDDLMALATAPGAYRQWADGDRKIQEATEGLRKVHVRIATLLRRVAPPDYRHSGVRGRSFLTNAAVHVDLEPSLKLDISKYYPSTRLEHVRRFFREDMQCAPDISSALADICCFERRHLPTGGVHSEVLAFFCHKRTLDEVHHRADSRGGKMSVYVDDIMVTMPNASDSDLHWATKKFEKIGLKVNRKKSRVLRKKAGKLITGVLIKNGELRAPQEQHMKIKQHLQVVAEAEDLTAAQTSARSLIGHFDHVAQIDERFKARAVGTRARLKGLLAPE